MTRAPRAFRRRRGHRRSQGGSGAETLRPPEPSARHRRRFARRDSRRRRGRAGARRPWRPRRRVETVVAPSAEVRIDNPPDAAAASASQGKNSPGSRLRPGAMSECASTRSGGIAWRRQMSLASAADRLDLRRRIGTRVVVAGMNDLDSDRGGVHVGLAGPEAYPGMPGAPRLRHELQHARRPPRRHNARRPRERGLQSRASAASAVGIPV